MSRRDKPNGKAVVIVLVVIAAVAVWPIALFLGVIYLGYKLLLKSSSKSEDNYHNYSETEPRASFCSQTNKTYTDAHYSSKNAFMTDCEKEYYAAFTEIVGDKYIIQPQINLASIVNKDSYSKYRSELFRNVDFGVFDKNYQLKLLIEINDKTHESAERRKRDHKVRLICEDAKIPLVTFWTIYGVDKSYIRFRLSEHLQITAPSNNEKKEPQNAD